MTKINDDELAKTIGRIVAEPANFADYPAPVIYRSQWGYNRAKCSVDGCDYDGLVRGYNQHYTRVHATDRYRQKAKRIIRAVRRADHE